MTVILTEEEKAFSIEVGDGLPSSGGAATAPGASSGGGPDDPEVDADSEDEMGLAVISGLVDDMEVLSGEDGGVIRMTWPTTPATVLP